MAKSGDEPEVRLPPESSSPTRRHRLRSFVVTSLVVIVVLLAFGFVAVRTDGGREVIRDWLSGQVGAELEIGKARIGWPYVLVLEEVTSRDKFSDGKPLLVIQRIKLGLGYRPHLRLSIRDCRLDVVRAEDGGWRPAAFGRLGELPLKNVAELTRMTTEVRRRMSLDISGGVIRWWDLETKPSLEVRGVAFRLASVRLPTRRMFHYHLSVDTVLGAGRDPVRDIEREWLASGELDYVEIGRSGGGTPGLPQGFWEGR